jgi:glycosyltransferase involved in cell wall biosynthesis
MTGTTRRVVHLTSAHDADDTRIFLKECRTLASAGYEVHLIAPSAADRVDGGVRTWGVHGARSGNRLVRMTLTVGKVYRRARSLAGDLYHFHDPELMPIALLLARDGAPVVYDVHEDLAASLSDKPWIRPRLRGSLARITKHVEPAAADRLAATVTATPAIEERFAGCRCEVITVNNYPQLTEFQHVPPREPACEPAVCYVGEMTPIRGIETMIEAIAETDVRLLLAGPLDTSFGDHLRTAPGWANVSYLGKVGRSQVAAMFARALAGIVVFRPAANHLRAQPTKMFEYMSAGLPVIASDFPLWREIVEASACGICVDPLSSEALGEAIRWIAAHPRQAQEMGENGRRAVRTTYNWEVEGRKLVALYERILRSWAAEPRAAGCAAGSRQAPL